MSLTIYFKLFEVIFPVFIIGIGIGLEKKSKFVAISSRRFNKINWLTTTLLAASTTLDFKTFLNLDNLLLFI